MKTRYPISFTLTALLLPIFGFADNSLSERPSSTLSSRTAPNQNSSVGVDRTAPQRIESLSMGEERAKPKQGAKAEKSESKMNLKGLEEVDGGGDAGGGDSIAIEAISYPDVTALRQALDVAQRKLQASAYPEEFKKEILAEMKELEAADEYRYLPEIIIFPVRKGELQDDDMPTDSHTFKSLGGLTWYSLGSTVIFSKRVTQYTSDEFAALLLHEVIHHILPMALSKDDDFVTELAKSIVSGQHKPRLAQALQLKAYFRPAMISRDQLWDAIDSSTGGLLTYAVKKYMCLQNVTCQKMAAPVVKARFMSHLPKNLNQVRVGVVANAIAKAFERKELATPIDSGINIVSAHLASAMNKLAKQTNPNAPDLQEGFFEKNEEIHNMLMKDYFTSEQNRN